jgi:teichuronic acid exporter
LENPIISNFNKIRTKVTSSSYLIDILLQGSGSALAQAIGVLSMPLLTRLYTPSQFGVLNMFNTIVGFLTIVVTWRYEYLIVLPRKNSSAVHIFTFITIYGLIVSFLLSFVGLYWGKEIALLLSLPEMSSWIVYAPITALLVSLSIALQQLVQRSEKYARSGISEIVNKLGYFSFALFGFYLFSESFGLILAAGFGLLLKFFWLYLSDRKILKPDGYPGNELGITAIKDYGKPAFSFSAANILQTVTGYVPIYVISKFYGTATLGQWSLVVSTMYLPTSVIGLAIGQVYYQRASKLFAEGNSILSIWLSTAKTLLLIAVPSFICIGVLSPWVFPILFGKQWSDAGVYASIVSVAAGISFISSPLDRTCYIVNVWYYPFLWNIIRMLGSLFVGAICLYYNFSFMVFLQVYVLQISLLYSIDLYISWRFANRIHINDGISNVNNQLT